MGNSCGRREADGEGSEARASARNGFNVTFGPGAK
jgi:hypothetical protein